MTTTRVRKIAASLIALALAGGIAASLPAEAATPVVSGALLYGVSQVWSIKDKKKR